MMKLLFSLFFCLYSTLAFDGPSKNQQIDGRIVGGNDTTITDHPYQISLEYENYHYCGGVIIARTWILTTTSCIENRLAHYYQVRAGTTLRGVGGQLIQVATIIPHPLYDDYDFDIALLQLEEPITLSRSAQIISLPNNGNPDIEGLIGTVTGWGNTNQTEPGLPPQDPPTVLQVVDVPIIIHSVCAELYNPVGYNVTERMFCAGLWDGGKDACTGDAGGPLVINSVLYGLVSWGYGCALPQRPGVYTNVGLLRDWITEHTGI